MIPVEVRIALKSNEDAAGVIVLHGVKGPPRLRDEVPLTPAGKAGRSAFSPAGPRTKNVPVTLDPGQVDKTPPAFDFDLASFFVLTTPGKYTVQYIYEEDQKEGWKGKLESNVMQIAVL